MYLQNTKQLISTLIFTLGCLFTTNVQVLADALEDLKQGVVVISVEGGRSCPKKVGSGFVVRQDRRFIYIVTASHVVGGCTNIGVQFYAEKLKTYEAKVLAQEGGNEQGLAILTTSVREKEIPNVTVLPLNLSLKVKSGDPITAIGFPRSTNVKWAVTQGEIIGKDGRALKFSGLVDGGNSGGPLFKNGNVIGIVAQTQGQFSYAVPSAIAQYILESWGVKFRVRLRSRPSSLPLSYIAEMVKRYSFHHPADLGAIGLSSSRQGTFEHDYEEKSLAENKVIIDHATGLMWEQFGSRSPMERDQADVYIQKLNETNFAGFQDWRLPTIEELASLIEPIGMNERTYINPHFFPLLWCWAVDDVTIRDTSKDTEKNEVSFYDVPVYVSFAGGAITYRPRNSEKEVHARAVRGFLGPEDSSGKNS